MSHIVFPFKGTVFRYTKPLNLDSTTYLGIVNTNEVLDLIGYHNTLRHPIDPPFTVQDLVEVQLKKGAFPLALCRTWPNSAPDLYLIEKGSFYTVKAILERDLPPFSIKDDRDNPVNMDEFFSYLT